MNNLPLQPLVWDWANAKDKDTNAICRAKSPSHEYIVRINAGGEVYVDYYKFDNSEGENNRKDEPPVFDSISAAQEWAQSTHHPSKMQPYVKPMPTWIDASERLPEKHTTVLVVYHAHFDDEPITEFDVCTAFFDGETFDPKDQLFYQKRNTTVTQWMPIPEFSTMQNLHKGGDR